jgi:uncharacterized membrane protein YeaQ/YmgE (transglycosylase-associated protein family)
MLDLWGWNVGMTLGGTLLVIFGALIIAAFVQMVGETKIGFEWVITAVATIVGAWLGSEAFGVLSTWGPVVEGVYLLPALLGAVVLGGMVDAIVRLSSGGYYLEPRPI